ncbi:hypothetical protein NP493_226g03003 [Ridgeia piscesae]|uniref:Pyridine nucleotide-disulfide oxidoreductase domain-containing protein 1 n=1 Tax=Ridgeia piscesae TaxID=27915 RepID=A0AAD9UDR5_RIDPI|nr:hypothetical protein NP493_226g03003 [Ridgeia piscesae]
MLATASGSQANGVKFKFVVIGGGIAGVTCVEMVTEMIQDFDVTEELPSQLESEYVNVTVVQRQVASLDSVNKMFQKRLVNARRIIVVGNGGIATELVYRIEGCEVVWAIKDDSINCVFLDPGASHFLLPRLNEPKKTERGPIKRMTYTLEGDSKEDPQPGGSGQAMGSALGPDWSVKLPIHGAESVSHRITVEYSVEVVRLMSPHELERAKRSAEVPLQIDDEFSKKTWPVYVQLSNGKVFGCDFVVSATGVQPCTEIFTNNNKMRLWGQARQMGAYAAQCMIADSTGDDIDLDICFELFVHVTKFFSNKVILLGRFNGQDLGDGYEILLRVTEAELLHEVLCAVCSVGNGLLVTQRDDSSTTRWALTMEWASKLLRDLE